ncbi:MAG: hypothetical protein HQL17_00165 [Candidatus Omnitrophica bacterium]|nr:hypothetical protein [Candidatus Omnitrophota bacterium]
MKNKKKVLSKITDFKKTLRDFVADEDGYVSKETMLKVGLSTVAGIGILGAVSDTFAKNDHTNVTSHTNSMTFSTGAGPGGCLVPEDATHSNVAPSHASHTSY